MDAAVAIVGGGPAGSTLALSLVREHGLNPADIVLLEKHRHPRDKPCAGAISNWGVRALEEIGVAIDVPFAEMKGVRVIAGSRSSTIERPLGVVVRRDELDASLFFQARAEGVCASDEEPLVALEREGGRHVLRTRAREIRARVLAACDGAGSTTRKLLGLKEPARKGHLYVTETEEREGDEGARAGLCDFDLGPVGDDLEGYYWDFPVVMNGKRCVSRGIYHANMRASKRVKESLAAHLARRGVAMSDVELRPFSTRPLVPASRLAGDGWVLVGEAAGIDRTTGEGIAQSILGARLAASFVARALRGDRGALAAYETALKRSRTGRHLLQSARLAPLVYGPRTTRAFQTYLVGSRFAIDAAARWYEGEPLGPFTLARLALGLARSALGS